MKKSISLAIFLVLISVFAKTSFAGGNLSPSEEEALFFESIKGRWEGTLVSETNDYGCAITIMGTATVPIIEYYRDAGRGGSSRGIKATPFTQKDRHGKILSKGSFLTITFDSAGGDTISLRLVGNRLIGQTESSHWPAKFDLKKK